MNDIESIGSNNNMNINSNSNTNNKHNNEILKWRKIKKDNHTRLHA